MASGIKYVTQSEMIDDEYTSSLILLGCCSVWAWRKSGIKSQATGRAHTIQKVQKDTPKSDKKVTTL